MAPRTDFPPIRACLFDMDGLLLDTEDLYTQCINTLLSKYGRPNLPWSVKAKMQGRPFPQSSAIFHAWAQLPITPAEYGGELAALQREHFPTAKPLPGVPELLRDLARTRWYQRARGGEEGGEGEGEGHRVHLALATSSHQTTFALKTAGWQDSLFATFPAHRRVLGDDARVAPGRGKPLPDIYLVALEAVNASLAPGEAKITPGECLVFEDSVPGVEAGRRAGMRVVWCPHPMLKREYAGREREILAGRMGEAGEAVEPHQLGQPDDGWAEELANLVDFPYEKYGITIPPPEVESDPSMQEDVGEVKASEA
ncbi:HAD-like domain-containing protein [Xylariomycetidae sp. FL0641]|nr:HAD-like domain-containing protein [Xylariomycetidae sp. FL0641]